MRAWLVIVLMVLLSGCALKHETDLFIPPAVVRAPVPSAATLRMKIVVRDMRPDKIGIGTAFSVVDPSSRYTVISRQPLETVVAGAVTSEFFVVDDAAVTTLTIDIKKADSQAKWSLFSTAVWAGTELTARVSGAGGHMIYGNTFAQSKDATNSAIVGSYDEGKQQLETVLAELVRSIPEDKQLVAALFQTTGR